MSCANNTYSIKKGRRNNLFKICLQHSPIPILLTAHGKGFNYFINILQPLIHPTREDW